MSFETAADADAHFDRINNDPEYRGRWFSTLAKTVAIDFDGVIHPYTEGWVGFVPADEPPMDGVEDFLKTLVELGMKPVVFSTRCDTPQGLEATKRWLQKWGLMPQYITQVSCQKPAAIAYVDDRAVPYKGDFRDSLVGVMELHDHGRPHGAAR